MLVSVFGKDGACLGLFGVRPEKGAEPVRIIERNGCYGALWSPDRSKIALEMDGNVYLAQRRGGMPRMVFQAPSHERDAGAEPFTWLPDSRRLVIDHHLPSHENETFVLDTETLDQRPIGRPRWMWVGALGGVDRFAFAAFTDEGTRIVNIPEDRIFDKRFVEEALRRSRFSAGPRTEFFATDMSPVTGEVLGSATTLRGDTPVNPRVLVVSPDGSAEELPLPRRFRNVYEAPIAFWTFDGDILVQDGRTLFRTPYPEVELQPILNLKAIQKAIPGARNFYLVDA